MKNLKRILAVFLLVFTNLAFACEACKIQQPKITQNITHGGGPGGYVDWIIVGIIALITVVTLFYSVKFLLLPGEKDKNHIKYSFLE